MGILRVALCQINTVVGDLDGNVAQILAAMDEAEAQQADLAVFPELTITGYPPEDLLLAQGFVDANRRALDTIASASKGCAAVVGFVESDRDLYNAAAVVADGAIHGIWRKEDLPNYGVFDERRWFVPGTGATPLFRIGGVRVAITICEDAWSPAGAVARQAAGGAELVVVLNASPYRAGALDERERMLATRAADASCPIAYVNLIGGQDELVFDGGSMLVDLDGSVLASAPLFTETVLVTDLTIAAPVRKRIIDPRGRTRTSAIETLEVTAARKHAAPHLVGPVAARLDRVEEVYDALVLATRDYIGKNGFPGVLVGISGGIDSALVATVASDALGADRVHGVAMPSRFSSDASLGDAEKLAANLGIELRVIEIEGAHAALLSLLEPSFTGHPADLTEENLQARIRGTLLMALSNKLGWLVLTTGNKSETAVGYSTLYGDTAGGFAVIKDVPKILVYELAQWRNARDGGEVIPEAILTKAPSAELRPDQRDDDSLPPYEVLDPILSGYVERDLTVGDLVDSGFDESVVRQVVALVDRAEYKRRQGPLGPRITSRAFGKDRRMPITSRYRPASAPLRPE